MGTDCAGLHRSYCNGGAECSELHIISVGSVCATTKAKDFSRRGGEVEAPVWAR